MRCILVLKTNVEDIKTEHLLSIKLEISVWANNDDVVKSANLKRSVLSVKVDITKTLQTGLQRLLTNKVFFLFNSSPSLTY